MSKWTTTEEDERPIELRNEDRTLGGKWKDVRTLLRYYGEKLDELVRLRNAASELLKVMSHDERLWTTKMEEAYGLLDEAVNPPGAVGEYVHAEEGDDA